MLRKGWQLVKLKHFKCSGKFYRNLSIMTIKNIEEKSPSKELESVCDDEKRMRYKPPKGSRDYDPKDMVIRNEMMRVIQDEFRKCGASSIDTPVFELQETLKSNYGEDEKLIYELDLQEGADSEKLALRYDLTVPLCRWIASNKSTIKSSIRAARIGKVYRRDTPRMNRGRYREFYQCDLDIVRMAPPTNVSDLVIDDCEVINMVCSVLTRLEVGQFIVRINNRRIFDSVCLACGVPEDKFQEVGSAVDKLDKKSWCEVRQEMVGEKGISPESADKIYEYLKLKGPIMDVYKSLAGDELLKGNETAQQALEDFKLLVELLEAYGWLEVCQCDMSMVRGLAYYTGFIMEANLTRKEVNKLRPLAIAAGLEPEAVDVGSIAGGGRYDELVSKFRKDLQCPCTGASIGFGRIFVIKSLKTKSTAKSCTKVMIGELQDKNDTRSFLKNRIQILQALRKNGISAEIYPKNTPDFIAMLDYCDDWGVPCVVLIGETEVEKGTVNIRRLPRRGDMLTKKDGTVVEFVEMDEATRKPMFVIKTPKGKLQKLPKKVFKKIATGNGGEETALMVEGVSLDELPMFIQRMLPL